MRILLQEMYTTGIPVFLDDLDLKREIIGELWGIIHLHYSLVACPYEIFKCTKCVKFHLCLFSLILGREQKKDFENPSVIS